MNTDKEKSVPISEIRVPFMKEFPMSGAHHDN
jgi:hypothetical protein